MTTAEEYTVVWNGSRDGPRGGLLLDYELSRDRERRERKAAEKPPTLALSRRPPWERAGLSRSTYYRRRAAAPGSEGGSVYGRGRGGG